LVYKMNLAYKERYYKPNVLEISIAYYFYIISSLFAMSANNFISLYFSLELHSISLISLMFVITFVMVNVDFIKFSYRSNSLDPFIYLMGPTQWSLRCNSIGTFFRRCSIISLYQVEAALKYFLLSIIFSYAILIGIAICYAFTGQTDITKFIVLDWIIHLATNRLLSRYSILSYWTKIV